MTWGEFIKLFMGKFFPASAKHANVKPRKKIRKFHIWKNDNNNNNKLEE